MGRGPSGARNKGRDISGRECLGVTGRNGGGATRHPQDMILVWGCDGAFQVRDRKESLAGAGGQAPGLHLGGGADR